MQLVHGRLECHRTFRFRRCRIRQSTSQRCYCSGPVEVTALQPARRVIKLSNYRAPLLTRSRPRQLLQDVAVDVDFYATRQIGTACTTEHIDGTFNTQRGRGSDTVAVSVWGAQSL